MATNDDYNYEEYVPSESYEESDMAGGGEQLAAAAAMVEEVVTQINEQKQNTVVLKPTDPPENPAVNDMWIDTNIYPNVIYTWDGVQWQKATATSAEEVGAYTVAQVDDALALIDIDTSALETRTEILEGQVADDTITSTVTQNDIYVQDRDAAVKAGVDGLVNDLQDENIINQKLPKMVTASQLQQAADSIRADFTKQGGVNLLKNSAAFAKQPDGSFVNWQTLSGSVDQQTGGDMVDAGSGFVMTDGVITQAVKATVGEVYTLTLKFKKGTAGAAYMKLSDGDTFQQMDMIDTQAYDYDYVQIKNFSPANPVLIVELGAVGVTGGAIFTAVMLNTGAAGLQWSLANGELYNTNLLLDINGLTIKSNVYDGYTVMAPSEFSGYYRNDQGVMQQVFTLNKDVTEVAKLKITDPNAEISMGSLKQIYIKGGGYDGWAIIPS